MKHWSDAQAEAAEARGRATLTAEPRAEAARYDSASARLVVDLTNGCTFAFPARRVQELETASDADLSLSGLMHGTFGTKAWMTELARRAGRATSPAKAAAARANGAKGGRPQKVG